MYYNRFMKNYFTTGQFAKLANVSERTIRYYDTQGLLKPSFVMENGYRKYSEEDFIRLQRIISLKQLGFSLDEIKMMDQNLNQEALEESLQMQIDLLEKRIRHSQLLKDSLMQTKRFLANNDQEVDWNEIVKLIQMSTQEEKIIEHYRDERHLSIRIHLHELFSVNKQGWFPWLFDQIDFTSINHLMEVGCGSGDLWKKKQISLRNRELFLSDISQGMVDSARRNLGEKYSYMVIDAMNIPFKQEYFDALIANHMLFYFNDIKEGIKELARVLKKGGILYCSAYGKDHMKEISELVQEFDERITLSDKDLSSVFGLENGESLLKGSFRKVEKRLYEDELIVDDALALYEYIMSCHGNQIEMLARRSLEFKAFLEDKMKQQKRIRITKNAGVFLCIK